MANLTLTVFDPADWNMQDQADPAIQCFTCEGWIEPGDPYGDLPEGLTPVDGELQLQSATACMPCYMKAVLL